MAVADTLVIAHRGASWALPENTFDAFEEAVRVGADMIELDVRRTGDGQLIAYHDPIGARRHEKLTAVGASSRPPLLRDVIARLAGRIALDIELKEDGCEAEVVALLSRTAAARCMITSFLDDVVRSTKAAAPGLQTGLVITGGSVEDALARARRAGADRLVLEADLARAAAAAGVSCLVWTVNEASAIDRCLTDPAILGVVTDRPALALERRAHLSGRTAPAAQC